MLTPGHLAPETDSGSGNQAPLSPHSFQGGHPYQLNSTPGKPRLGACAELPRSMCGAAQGHAERTAAPGRAGLGAENPPFSTVLSRFLSKMFFPMKPGKSTGVWGWGHHFAPRPHTGTPSRTQGLELISNERERRIVKNPQTPS